MKERAVDSPRHREMTLRVCEIKSKEKSTKIYLFCDTSDFYCLVYVIVN